MQNKSVLVNYLHWLNKYDRFGAGICSCRKQQAMRGEGSGQIEGEYCIGVEIWQLYGRPGTSISKKEALEIIERAEHHGYVHQITNIDGEDKIVAICNCTARFVTLRTSQL